MAAINIDDIVDFGDLGDLLKSSGITVSTDKKIANDDNVDKKDNDLHQQKKASSDTNNTQQDPFANALAGFNQSTAPTASFTSNTKDSSHDDKSITQNTQKNKSLDDCIICCNPMYIKIALPCKHTFCFSCVKGHVLRQSFHQKVTCPACTQSLPDWFKHTIKHNPHKLVSMETQKTMMRSTDVFWFYSGSNGGWWAYEQSNNKDIEAIYQDYLNYVNTNQSMVTICGQNYSFNFDKMVQLNLKTGGYRRIKRVEKQFLDKFTTTNTVKGLAGLKMT